MNNYITYGDRLVDGDMRMNPEQSEAVHLIFDAYDGGESIKKIVGMLKDSKASTTRGKPSWTPALIRKILRNKDYLGVEPYPRMIEDEQFKRVQEHLKRSRDIWNQRHPTENINIIPAFLVVIARRIIVDTYLVIIIRSGAQSVR